MNTTYLHDKLYYADLSKGVGSEQEGYRPVLIIQNNVGNKYSHTVIVAAVTSKVGVKPKLSDPLLYRSRYDGINRSICRPVGADSHLG